MQTKVLQI